MTFKLFFPLMVLCILPTIQAAHPKSGFKLSDTNVYPTQACFFSCSTRKPCATCMPMNAPKPMIVETEQDFMDMVCPKELAEIALSNAQNFNHQRMSPQQALAFQQYQQFMHMKRQHFLAQQLALQAQMHNAQSSIVPSLPPLPQPSVVIQATKTYSSQVTHQLQLSASLNFAPQRSTAASFKPQPPTAPNTANQIVISHNSMNHGDGPKLTARAGTPTVKSQSAKQQPLNQNLTPYNTADWVSAASLPSAAHMAPLTLTIEDSRKIAAANPLPPIAESP